MWWDARSKTSRQNALLALVVGGLFVAIILAALARDKAPGSRVVASRPQPAPTLALPTPSTVHIDNLGAGPASMTAADLFGSNTTSTTPAPATTAPAPPTTRRAPATTAPAPATTVTNPDVVFNTVPPDTTTTTRPPVTTTAPPPTTTTTTSTLLPPLTVPGLLAPG